MSAAGAAEPGPGGAVLAARNIAKSYGSTHALRGVNFDIHRGKVTTLFGGERRGQVDADEDPVRRGHADVGEHRA